MTTFRLHPRRLAAGPASGNEAEKFGAMLSKSGHRPYGSTMEAARAIGRTAWDDQQRSASDWKDRKERGAMIFRYGQHCWATPLVVGTSASDNNGEEAHVPVQALVDRLPLSVAMHQAVTIVAMVHSHPFSPGFAKAFGHGKDDDVEVANDFHRMSGTNKLSPYLVAFEASFVMGPSNKGETEGSPLLRQYPVAGW
jgi:hypothetical protein